MPNLAELFSRLPSLPPLPVPAATVLRGAESALFTAVALAPFAVQQRVLETLLAQAYPEALADGLFEPLRGRRLRIDVLGGPGWTVTMGAQAPVVVPERVSGGAGDWDARIACSFEDFVLLADQQADPDTLFFQRRLVIEGDTELGLYMKHLVFGNALAGKPATVLKALVVLREKVLAAGAGTRALDARRVAGARR